MKFSARTIQILRNFATVHQTLLFKQGRNLKVISDSKSVLAKATLDANIDSTFAIYDMPRFLSAISMFDDPELTPNDSYIEIRQGNEKINYTCAEQSLIKTPPEKEPVLPSIDVQFELKNETINRVLKGMAITGANALCITGEDGRIFLEAKTITTSKAQPTSSGAPTYRAEVGVTDKKFSFIIMADNFKLLNGDYNVSVSQRGLSHFSSADVEYWIAVEANSSFDG
jgi:hypothetical protein